MKDLKLNREKVTQKQYEIVAHQKNNIRKNYRDEMRSKNIVTYFRKLMPHIKELKKKNKRNKIAFPETSSEFGYKAENKDIKDETNNS